MRQTSEQFMDEMLKDNSSAQASQGSDLAEQIAKTIDEKLEKAMSKFTEQFAKVSEPTDTEKVETPEKKPMTTGEKLEELIDEYDEKEGEENE